MSWWMSVGALALVAATLYACGTTGTTTSKGRVSVPFFTVDWGFNSNHFDVTSNQPHVCVTITWFDADGTSVGEGNFETDDQGSASGDVPDGAARFKLTIVPCPEEALAGSPYASIALRDHWILGAPIIPSADADGDNRQWAFRVRASSLAQADALAMLVLDGGIGAPVPTAVEVLTLASLTANLGGARLVQAQPGAFEQWRLDVNDGAFHADLASAAHYTVNGWDVVETTIPLSAFEYGIVPGVTYSNAGDTQYKTDRMSDVATASHQYAFEY